MAGNRRDWLPRLLIESVLIVFSVLFALALNEWREERALDRRIDQALAAIEAEVSGNRTLVEGAREYHTTLARSFRASAEARQPAPDMQMITLGLLAPARVLRTAWQSAQNTGVIAEIPYSTVLVLSNVYTWQQEYEDLSRAMLQVTYGRVLEEGFDETMRHYVRFVPLQQDFADREEALIGIYDDALTTLR